VRLAVALAVLISTTAAFAQGFAAPTTRAAKLFSEGRELKAAGKLDEACKRFESSWSAERATGTQLNLADCREREGKLLEAWRLFDEAAKISESEGNARRATFARDRAAALDAKLMSIDVRLTPPIAKNTQVTIDGQPPGTLTTRTDPKGVWIRATAPDGKTFAVHVEAQAGRVIVDVPSLVRTKTVRRSSRLWIAGGLVVMGAVGAVTAQRFTIVADDVRDGISGCRIESTGRTCDTVASAEVAQQKLALADRNDVAAKVFLGGSAVLIVGAAIVWYTAPKERVLITPTATTSSVGVSLAARF
jgi:hypothetical protein